MTAPRSRRVPAARASRVEWRKPPPDLVDRFNAALPVHPDAKPRKMFGYPACFVNGNFFVGLHNENALVRLPGALKHRFAELEQASPFDPMGTGKGLKDWWLIPTAITGDPQRLAAFFAAAFVDVQALPPKKPKVRTSPRTNRKKP